jgi:hypothetical protein
VKPYINNHINSLLNLIHPTNSRHPMKTRFIIPVLLLATLCNTYAQKKTVKASFDPQKDETMVRALLKKIDADVSDTSVYANDVVHMAQGSRAITDKNQLANVLKAEASYGKLVMTHEVLTINSYESIVLVRGRVRGMFYGPDQGTGSPFETNNLMTFKRQADGSLRIWHVIFNRIDLNQEQARKNPFNKFLGEWTLKNNDWSQNWGNGDEHIKIENHHTVNRELNTAHTLLSVIDGAPPHGHIVWTYDPAKKTVHHQSSFGDARIGVGEGTVNENGDVKTKISFSDEAPGTYRLYAYIWVDDNEYHMKSVQHSSDGKPTGLFYEGTFVRVKK